MNKKRLTRKELVKHIRQTMPSDYNEIERLAFIEKEVADQISFDEKYLWGDIGTKEKIYKLSKREAQTSPKEIKRNLICINMAELYGYVAKNFGFNVKYQTRAPGLEINSGDNEILKTISSKKQEHVCPIVKLSNGKFIEVDIQHDLARLQTRSKPRAFGLENHSIRSTSDVKIGVLNNDLVNDAFKKVYHLGEDEKFTDEYIRTLAGKLRGEGKTPIEMLELFMQDPRITRELQNTKCIEANKLYKAILRVCYDVSIEKQFLKENDRAIIEECILSDDKGNKRYSFCIYAEDEREKAFFIYSKKSKRMIKLTQEEIQQMTQQVMNVELRGRSSELRKNMMSFVSGENEIPIKNVTQSISLEDIFVDEDEEELE